MLGTIYATGYDWSDANLVESTKDLVRGAIDAFLKFETGKAGHKAGPYNLKILVLCADCVHAPLYGQECVSMLCQAIQTLYAELCDLDCNFQQHEHSSTGVPAGNHNPSKGGLETSKVGGLEIEFLLSMENRSPDDGFTENFNVARKTQTLPVVVPTCLHFNVFVVQLLKCISSTGFTKNLNFNVQFKFIN